MAVQSHMCEQLPEVEYTLRLFPHHKHTADIFDTANLLTCKVGDSALASHNGSMYYRSHASHMYLAMVANSGHMQVTSALARYYRSGG